MNQLPGKVKRLKENTFLLALDGDVDFEPSAVMLLVDLMKRDLRVAAACGRIHPTGSGTAAELHQKRYIKALLSRLL